MRKTFALAALLTCSVTHHLHAQAGGAANNQNATSPANSVAAAVSAQPSLTTPYGTVTIFPTSNPWNTDISNLPVHPNSQKFIASIGLNTGLHPDFGTVYNGTPNGIPYLAVPRNQPKLNVTFQYAGESDRGPYPLPNESPIEGGPNSTGDRHVILIDAPNHTLYELYSAYLKPTGWTAGSGAIWNLSSNTPRPVGWTSADAAGLPIFPGLVRYDEVVTKGAIRHALRFTVQHSQHGYISPARHFASSSTNPNLPPMGLRLRLHANFNMSGYSKNMKVILTALQHYGMFVADNGSNWYISGAPDPRWNDDDLHTLGRVKGSDFEVVETGPIVTK